ncbi:NAD(P)-binding protein [Microcoleus sp. AR_TQ3_B6]|uniref:NAD(P)-binding protein n=1 Tax=Microcoleus sp. AR_TQ3_B6 TaxID=3055284 RepID=UPI00403F35FC
MFDGMIVGAGPAGSTAGYHRAKQGRSVLVLEKASLLRNKPGGGVSGAIAQLLDFDRTPAISLKANKITYTWKMQDPVKVEINSPWASNCRLLLSRAAKFCAANCVMPISLTAPLKS